MDGAEVDREDGRSARSGFLRSAEVAPDALALSIGPRTWSYSELEHSARVWAHALLSALERRPRQVGVLAYRSEVSFAGMLAALFAGSTVVPLNPNFPAGRTRTMIELADLDAVLVEERYLAHLREALPAGEERPVVLVPNAQGAIPELGRSTLSHEAVDGQSPLVDLPPVLAEEIAYLMFTSGSTGVPKGVPVMHSNLLHFVDVMMDRFRIGPEDRLSQTFDQSFDASVFDFFLTWEAGASLHVLSPLDLVAPTAFANRHELTVWYSVPSVASVMRRKDLLRPGALPGLRLSLFVGEALSREIAELWQAAAPNSVLENLYGPTELTVTCFAHRWDPGTSPGRCVNGIVPIGRPHPGVGAIVVDENGDPVGDGHPGELLVCGPQTVPGYWRSPEKTAERFLELPVRMATMERRATFYATGDRVVIGVSGEYAYLGRDDQQIKLGGYRIELGEIEAVLRRSPGVTEAVAAPWPLDRGVAQGLVAFLTGTGLSAEAVIEEARKLLPRYMIPGQVFIVDQMPLNANGKIDRKALLEPLVLD